MRPLKIALVAILRNEAEYLLEWIAWHRSIGFTHFFLSDNQSDDGTRELLQHLAARGVVRVRDEPRGENAQFKAYAAMLAAWGGDVDRVMVLDGDEFLVAQDGGSPLAHLESLISRKNVGAVAVNWRLFGSSGHTVRTEGLVTERFTGCAPDDHTICRHFKSYSKPELVLEQRAHHAVLPPGYRYLDTEGRDVVFVSPKGNVHVTPTGLSQNIASGQTRVHHYVIKSLQEFREKKQKRGNAITGPEVDRGEGYFLHHDMNDIQCQSAARRSATTHAAIRELNDLMEAPPSRAGFLRSLWIRMTGARRG